jgi:multiple sugar transport system substrate-binding protein
MKYFFIGSLAFLIVFSLVAWFIQPAKSHEGKTPLVWVCDDNPARREQMDLFNELNPDLYLSLDPSNTDMQKVIVQCIGGVGPDLFTCYDGIQLSAYVNSGIAWDVTEELKREGIDVEKDLWRATDPTFIYQDRVYGFPANVAVNAIWFNKDILDSCGIAYPEGELTWEELIALAKKLTVMDDNGRYRHFGFLFDFGSVQQFLKMWGVDIYSKDGTRCTLDSPEAIAAVQFMYDLIYKYKVSPSPVQEAAMATQGGWGSGVITWFGGGKAAMAIGGRWWLCLLRNYENLHLGAVACPHGPGHKYLGYGKSILINKNSPRRREAFRFLTYMYDKPYNDLINHQADALAPVKKYCYTEEYLHDPEYPNEDFNEVWRDIMNFGEPEPVSPFVSGSVVYRIMGKQLDLVKANEKTPEEAMKTAARLINEQIQQNVERYPHLKRMYLEKIGKGSK